MALELQQHNPATAPEYDFNTIKSSLAFVEAESKNSIVVLPKENELFLDIDDLAGRNTFLRNKTKFSMHVATIEDYTETTSRGGNTHIVVKLGHNIDPQQRIIYQVLLGSDRIREMLSWIRLINEDPNPTLFFETKNAGLLTEGQPNDAPNESAALGNEDAAHRFE